MTTTNDASAKKLAIACAGGPAPGINQVIAAVTAAACSANVEVVGLQDGFRWVMAGDTDARPPADAPRTRAPSTSAAGRTSASRAPTRPRTRSYLDETLAVARASSAWGMLVTIGGDDTAFTAFKLADGLEGSAARRARPQDHRQRPRSARAHQHLRLPDGAPHRHRLVRNLLVDAQTTSRWYFVIAMGRKAGPPRARHRQGRRRDHDPHPGGVPASRSGSDRSWIRSSAPIIKRLARGGQDGVAMLAEGLVEHPPGGGHRRRCASAERDAHGHIRIAEIDFGEIVKQAVQKRLKELGIKARPIVSKDIGYELRCADPIPFDLEYTRDLGYCAARYIIEGGTEAIISIQDGKFVPLRFVDVMDPVTRRMRVRMVDVTRSAYATGRSFMVRLGHQDLDDPVQAAKLAKVTGMSTEKLREALGAALKQPVTELLRGRWPSSRAAEGPRLGGTPPPRPPGPPAPRPRPGRTTPPAPRPLGPEELPPGGPRRPPGPPAPRPGRTPPPGPPAPRPGRTPPPRPPASPGKAGGA